MVSHIFNVCNIYMWYYNYNFCFKESYAFKYIKKKILKFKICLFRLLLCLPLPISVHLSI